MEILKNKLTSKLNIRTQKDYPQKGIEFIDIMPLMMEKQAFQEMIQKLVEPMKKEQIDYVVAPEARGFLIGSVIANELQTGFIPIRKVGKLPPSTIELEFEYEKEYGKDKLALPKLMGESYQGKRCYVVDDIYATGNTMKAIEKAIKSLGGQVVGKAVIMNIVALNQDTDIFSLLEVKEN